tara:strand:+ start:63 stop:260 length:198 start_codon:yes stop_codon:yes gene_type:complete
MGNDEDLTRKVEEVKSYDRTSGSENTDSNNSAPLGFFNGSGYWIEIDKDGRFLPGEYVYLGEDRF